MVFNIGSQSGGVINNVAGDQTVSGTQHGVQVSLGEARSAVEALRVALEHTSLQTLSPEQREAVHEDVEAIAGELEAQEPAPERVKPRFERLTRLLKDAGALAGAGAALLGPLTALGRWIGTLGVALL